MYFDDWNKKSKNKQISRSLLWEYDMDNFPWQKMGTTVMQRIIERGWPDDFYAAIAIYGGIENTKNIIKQIPVLSAKNIAFVSLLFDIPKKELKCYTRKQLREQHLSF